jgi:two-component system CheB/CheR fusion protein
VFTADNGLDGVALIERLHPDLAIVDLGLPVMSGHDLARRIRATPANNGTRLVALSGYGQDSDVQAALDAGFDEHLTKPPDPDRLEQVLAGRPADRRQRRRDDHHAAVNAADAPRRRPSEARRAE